jgi:hypothetical protein
MWLSSLQSRALLYKTRVPISSFAFILFELLRVFFSNKLPLKNGKENLRAWSPRNPIKA